MVSFSLILRRLELFLESLLHRDAGSVQPATNLRDDLGFTESGLDGLTKHLNDAFFVSGGLTVSQTVSATTVRALAYLIWQTQSKHPLRPIGSHDPA